MYHYILGLPTEHAGSWTGAVGGVGAVACGSAACSDLPHRWAIMTHAGATWGYMQALACQTCATERERRNRLIGSNDDRVRAPPFLGAQYIHRHNDPQYHAMLLRAMEHA